MKQGVLWPNQNSEGYKNELCKRAVDQNMYGPRLTTKHRETYARRILRFFSAVFWFQGCHPPKVDGVHCVHHSGPWSTTEDPAAV